MDFAASFFKKTKFGNNIGVKTYQYTFVNTLGRPIIVLVEEDPDGMRDQRMAKLKAVKTVGEAAQRAKRQIQNDYDTICQTSYPFQEVKVVTEQMGTASMRSPVVRCTVAVGEWNGALRIIIVKRQLSEGDVLRITKTDYMEPRAVTLRADSVEHALLHMGLPVGLQKGTGAKEAVEENASKKEEKPVQAATAETIAASSPKVPQPPAQAKPAEQRSPKHQQLQQKLQQQPQPQPNPCNSEQTRLQPHQRTPPQTSPEQPLGQSHQQACQGASSQARPCAQTGQFPGQSPCQAQTKGPPWPSGRQGAASSLVQPGSGACSGKAQGQASKAGAEPAGGKLPAGFLPTLGKVSVYSNSGARWMAGALIGINLGCSAAAPPGAVCVQYDLGNGTYTQKVLFPEHIPTMLRQC
eukprot:TRINITY_DN72_c2_g1_i1.p1 TRINITY_DN72_c2_g1~~TRINITY_DN72_c2_g1_i1.p1  ORF type:complete len:409 (+),score=89.09 TRINITY_DN72_c2_g1_i1:59-1285(+)